MGEAGSVPGSLDVTGRHVDRVDSVTAGCMRGSGSLFSRFVRDCCRPLRRRATRTVDGASLTNVTLRRFALLGSCSNGRPRLTVLGPGTRRRRFRDSRAIVRVITCSEPFLMSAVLVDLRTRNVSIRHACGVVVDIRHSSSNGVTRVRNTRRDTASRLSVVRYRVTCRSGRRLTTLRRLLLTGISALSAIINS